MASDLPSLTHANRHAVDGEDEVQLDASQITSGTFDLARIPNIPVSKVASGTPNGTKFIRDDGVLAVPPGTGGGGGGSSVVTSVFSRIGDVVAASGDYNLDQINETATNKLYSAIEKLRLAGTSGTNTGDETLATIKAKLGITTLSGSNTGDQTLPTTLPPNGAAGGDLSGSYPNPELGPAGTAGTYGDAIRVPQFTTDAKGRVVAVTPIAITHPTTLPPNGAAGGDLSGTYPNPGVAKVNGISISGTPAVGAIPQATSPTTAVWTPVSAGVIRITAKSGEYYQPVGSQLPGSSYYMNTQNLLTFSPIWIPVACTAIKLAVQSGGAGGTGGSTGGVRVGLYSPDATGRPGSLLLDAGFITGVGSGGILTVTINQALPAGLVWMATVTQVNTCSCYYVNISPDIMGMPVSAAGIGQLQGSIVQATTPGGSTSASVTGALPSTAVPGFHIVYSTGTFGIACGIGV